MKKYIPQLFVALVLMYLLFLIRLSLFGQLTGTFKPHTVPKEYIKLEEFLSKQKQFGRTFWVPSIQRFGFYSSTHPAVSGEDFYHVASIAGVLDNLKNFEAEKKLEDSSVEYVVVPFDSEGEIFLKDRAYDEATYMQTLTAVRNIPWLKEISRFGRMHVFAVSHPKDHIWLEEGGNIEYKMINPTVYTVSAHNVQKGEKVIFVESYDSGWKAYVRNTVITSKPFEKQFNSFVLPQSGSYTVRVFYQPQQWVNVGLWVSGLTLIVCTVGLLLSGYSWFRKSKMVE